ncbi:MAG: 6-hydroxymethylpterin diphosphokinase MptE-like protein [Promethearchaeota archaeon]|jgi:hypothetical protein
MKNYLEKNLESLKKYNKELFRVINEAEKPEDVESLIKSKDKRDNFIFKTMNQRMPAYDVNSVIKHVNDIVDKVQFLRESVTVCIGSGFGHLIYKVLKKKEEKHKIILVEPEAWFLKKSFELYDFTKWIENLTFIIASPTIEVIVDTIKIVDSFFVVENYNILIEKYALFWVEKYSDVLKSVQEIINHVRCGTGTIQGVGDIIAHNDIKNLPYCIRHHGIKEIKGLYKNKPAVVISTGPSLAKNIHLLIGENRKKVIVIAVAQALRVLLAYDIVPDFICTVDYGEVNYEHFDGLMDVDVPLVALNRSYDKILAEWKGHKFIVGAYVPGYEKLGIGVISEKGQLEQGGSVSHMAFALASHLECNPIILMGQDLAYEDDKSHIPLVDAGGKVKVDDDGILKWEITDKKSILKEKGGEYVMSDVKLVPGYYGGLVKTNVGLLSFITAFEAIFKNMKDVIVIDATEGGAYIKGSKRMTLKTALRKYAKWKINKRKINKYLCFIPEHHKIIEETIPKLEDEVNILKRIIESVDKALEYNNLMNEHYGEKDLFRKYCKENEIYSNLAHELTKKMPLLTLSIYRESREISSRKLKVDGKLNHIEKNKKDFNIRLERNKLILNAAKDESKVLIGLYEDAIKKLKDYMNGKYNLYEESKYKPSIEDADEFFKVDNWGRPYLEAIKILQDNFIDKKTEEMCYYVRDAAILKRDEAIQSAKNRKDMQPTLDCMELIKKSRDLGKEYKFEESIKVLKKAIKVDPKNEDALWGYATTLHHVGKIKESLEAYENIMYLYPENLQYKFEYGQVILREDIQEGLKIIGEVIAKTDRFDSFLARIGDLYTRSVPSKAIEAYEAYLEKWPYDISVNNKLARLYKEHNQKKYEVLKKKIDKLLYK